MRCGSGEARAPGSGKIEPRNTRKTRKKADNQVSRIEGKIKNARKAAERRGKTWKGAETLKALRAHAAYNTGPADPEKLNRKERIERKGKENRVFLNNLRGLAAVECLMGKIFISGLLRIGPDWSGLLRIPLNSLEFP